MDASPNPVGRVSSPGGSGDTNTANPSPAEQPPRRLRRLHRIWPDRDGNISSLLTLCVNGRERVLDNDPVFDRFVAFLFDSPARYGWFGRRFVIMPDHVHLIARMGREAISLGQWIKALKAVVGGLEHRAGAPSEKPDSGDRQIVGRVPSHGVRTFTRMYRTWRWQKGFHDHKFRTPESEQAKWHYVCLNPVRAGLVKRPEEWPYGGEIFYDEADEPRLVRGTPPLLETRLLMEEPTVDG